MKIKDLVATTGLTAQQLKDIMPKKIATDHAEKEIHWYVRGTKKNAATKAELERLFDTFAHPGYADFPEVLYIFEN